MDIVGNNLLVDFLGVAIRRSSLLVRSILGDRQVLWPGLSIYRAGRREDDALDMILRHKLKQIDERNHIVAIIEQWFLHTLSYCLAGSKVDDALYIGIFLEHSLCGSLVAQVYLLESRTHTCYLLNTVQYFYLRIGQIVYYHYVVACLLQLHCGVASDKACTTSHQNCLFHSYCFLLNFSKHF